MLSDPGEAEEAAHPAAPGDAGSRAVVTEQGVGARTHLEEPGGGELAVEEEAEFDSPAEVKRRECECHDVGLFTRGQGSENTGRLRARVCWC